MKDTYNKEKFELEKFINKYFYFIAACILIIAGFNLFYRLGLTTVQDWDEARHGITAYEMIKNNNYLITTYGFNVDYYNLKPPLGMILIAIAYKIFGYSIFAMRFFSPISSLISIIIVGKILKDNVSKFAAIFGMIVLSTNYLFIIWHAGRTGDVDAVLTLVFTIIMYFLIKMNKDIKYFYLAGFVYSVSFLLKSYATMQIVAVVGLVLLCTGTLFKLKIKQLMIFLGCSFIPIFVWMGLRYRFDGTKFLGKMITYDVLARSTSTIEGQKGSIAYYLIYSISYNFHWVLYMAIILSVYFITNKFKFDFKNNKFLKFSIIIWAVVPFILFSLSTSKLVWYINTIYPAVSILIGWLSYNIYKSPKISKTLRNIILIVFLICALFGQARILHKINSDTMPDSQKILMSLKYKIYTKNVDIYYGSEWTQANRFIVEVIDEMNPKQVSKENFVNKKLKGLYVLNNNKENSKFVMENKLKVLCENEDYIIVK
jgi:4-amino-4-deoxy-L-arabinose transferase-like glycosyltransferase